MSAEPAPTEVPKAPLSVLDKFMVVKKAENDPEPPSSEAVKPQNSEPQDPTRPLQEKSATITLPDPASRATASPSALSPKASENFRKLEESKLNAEKERDELKKQLAAFPSEKEALLKQVEDLKAAMAQQRENAGNVDGLQLTVESQQQKILELQRELKAAAVTRDPEFQDKYVHTKKFHQDILGDAASVAGIAKEEVDRSLRAGDEARLQEIREALPPKQQRQWDAALSKMEQIDQERQMAEKDAEKTYDQLQAQRVQRMKQAEEAMSQEDRKIGKTVLNGIYKSIPQIKDNEPLVQELHGMVEAISGGQGAEKWTKDTIISGLLMSRVYEGACANMHGIIEKLEADLKAEKEERGKLEGLMKSRGIPYGDGGGFTAPASKTANGFDPKVRLSDQIMVQRRS